MANTKVSALPALSLPATGDYLLAVQASGPTSVKLTLDRLGGLLSRAACGGRLTLTSGTPVTIADVTGATSVYFSPYSASPWAGLVSVYDGTRWRLYAFSELTLALGSVTAGLPYDVFLADNGSGSLILEKVAWTNGTTRATALALTDGIYTKSGDATRRYLGTFYTTSTTATEDSAVKRFLWNYYNRVRRRLVKDYGSADWTYSTAAWRQANASAANQLEIVVGVAEDPIDVDLRQNVKNSAASVWSAIGIGEDSTTLTTVAATGEGYVGWLAAQAATGTNLAVAFLRKVPAIGYHKYCGLEYGAGSGTTTFFGSTSSSINELQGAVMA